MNMKPENYKGYAVKFVEKMMKGNNGDSRLVYASFPSKVTGKMLGEMGSTKDVAFNKCKKMIDREMNTMKM